MAATVYEFFGFPATDTSAKAIAAADAAICPFLGDTCTKTFNDGVVAGVCTIKPVTTGPVICCPIRLYADNYRILRNVADRAFRPGIPIHPGGAARAEAIATGGDVIAVFGKGYGGELRLPQRKGRGGYFVDWILAHLDGSGSLLEFVALEVQSIDTTGSYRVGRDALLQPRRTIVQTSAGLNWENVSKRILPQLLYKGHVLQREQLCTKGLFFVAPQRVYEKIMERLGGASTLMSYPMQSSSITFMSYDFDLSSTVSVGSSIPLRLTSTKTTNITQIANAFSMPLGLPPQDCYRDAIKAAL